MYWAICAYDDIAYLLVTLSTYFTILSTELGDQLTQLQVLPADLFLL